MKGGGLCGQGGMGHVGGGCKSMSREGVDPDRAYQTITPLFKSSLTIFSPQIHANKMAGIRSRKPIGDL